VPDLRPVKSYFGELYESFKSLKGFPLSLASLVLAILAFHITPNAVVYWKYVIVAGLIGFLVLLVFFDFSVRLYKRTKFPLPKVPRALPPPSFYKGSKALLLLEPSELFGQQALVAIFSLKDEFEVFVGFGEAITIQEDKKIQISVNQAVDPSDRSIWDPVLSNDRNALEKLIIKPSLPANVGDISKS
jgi:hypothetical protein